MSAPVIAPEKLAAFGAVKLDHGSHPSFEKGHCAMEVVAWLADEGHTDAPECASPVLRRYIIDLNDRWDDEKRQTLKPYLLRTIGTANDGLDPARERIAAQYVGDLVAPWLRLAGMEKEAAGLEAAGSPEEVRWLLQDARDAAWRLRSEKRAELRAVIEPKIREHLAKKNAVADADAALDAVAAVAAAAVAAGAGAFADAAVVAVADAAVADAAAAVTVAAAAVVAEAALDNTYNAAYWAARNYYKEHPLPITQAVADLVASQKDAALDLLDRLIDAREEA